MYGRFVAHGPWAFTADSGAGVWVLSVAAGRAAITAPEAGVTVVAETGDRVVIGDRQPVVVTDGSTAAAAACPATATPVVRGLARHGRTGPLTDLRAMRIGAPARSRPGPLPALLRLDPDPGTTAALDATFALLEHERDSGAPGAGLVLDRLADVLITHTVRAVATTTAARPSTLLSMLNDPQIGRAAQAMRGDLAHPWTVASLAREARMSRAGFAASFRRTTGYSPFALLRHWRLCEAKRLLGTTGLTLTEIALRVGYESAPALSRAFSRQEQVTPGEWRRRGTTSEIAGAGARTGAAALTGGSKTSAAR
ncbi:AraC family transcriptional regulator [Actinoplanes sp. NPDC049265]|uniref:helix-turn-helix transcriptional regulator n=1 Tax=Actinoplanes sp. NPDC049265 TaxID=3363902 RepID=UPI0037176623